MYIVFRLLNELASVEDVSRLLEVFELKDRWWTFLWNLRQMGVGDGIRRCCHRER